VLTVTRSPSAATLLSRHVHEVRILTASSLAEAADLARSVVPQALIVDTNVVDIDLDGLRELASEWGLLQVPLIACTLPGEEPLRQQLHVSGYLIKPVTREALWDVLRQQDGAVERVLIIDDDRDFVLLMSRLLEDDPLRSYQVIGAYNGREGLEMAQHYEPDLLLLDLGLPDLDGRQVIERLQRIPVTAEIPIVVVSGQDELTPQATAQGFVAVTRTDGLPSHDLLACVRQIATSTFSEQREPPEPRSDRPR
jgi:CheY-like chemotaxis protein